jgi:hypothetical protein
MRHDTSLSLTLSLPRFIGHSTSGRGNKILLQLKTAFLSSFTFSHGDLIYYAPGINTVAPQESP